MYLLCREAAARGLSNRMVLACLLHDASECYMSDVPTPFKNELPEYQEQEEHLLGIIYEKFLGSDLTEEEQKELKKIDHAMLWYDLEHLLGEIQYGEIPELHIDLDYTVRPFEEVEEEYLSLSKNILEHFAYEIGNERVSEMLSNALRKRHPYRVFKDKINELGISQLYYDYRSQAYLDKAEEWCRENSVAYRRNSMGKELQTKC